MLYSIRFRSIHIILFSGLFTLVVFTTSCNLVDGIAQSAGLDTEVPEEPANVFNVPLPVIVEGPENNSIISNDEVTFRWTHSLADENKDPVEYQYRLVGKTDWSSWVTYNEATIRFLSDKKYSFEIQCRLQNEPQEGNMSASPIDFEVDVLSGPAITFSPHGVSTSASSFSSDIILEEVSNVLGAKIDISFDANKLSLNSIDLNDEITSSISAIAVVDQDDRDNGHVIINIGFIGNNNGFSGTGSLGTMNFDVLRTESTEIMITQESELRDSNNQAITINALRGIKVRD